MRKIFSMILVGALLLVATNSYAWFFEDYGEYTMIHRVSVEHRNTQLPVTFGVIYFPSADDFAASLMFLGEDIPQGEQTLFASFEDERYHITVEVEGDVAFIPDETLWDFLIFAMSVGEQGGAMIIGLRNTDGDTMMAAINMDGLSEAVFAMEEY